MENQSGRQILAVNEALYQEPYTFEFDQAVKLVEVLHARKLRMGEGISFSQESLILKSRVFLSAPPSDVFDITRPTSLDQPATMRINFFGIAGLQGPLPLPFTEIIMDRVRRKDTAFNDFLDIFNHRFASILHRIRKKHWVGLDSQKPHMTMIGQDLLSLTGMISGFTKTKKISPQDMLYYSGLFWQKPRSGIALKQILSHYYKTDVAIFSHQGGWVDIPRELWTYMGSGGSGVNNVLGQTAMCGRRTWDVNQNIRIKLGPMSMGSLQGFLKNGHAYPQIIELLQQYLPAGYTFSLNLSVLAKDVCETRLNNQSYLGWTSWLISKPAEQNDSQIILYPSDKDLFPSP
ncbi:MAG: type VI secretion system baseplate subunit TssG [Alphaproteobacteria bacterium]|nr:type VI secretion system baseplate subunit TssG [Alphaproteobacteria bacterium]